jgi:hypothetical protein
MSGHWVLLGTPFSSNQWIVSQKLAPVLRDVTCLCHDHGIACLQCIVEHALGICVSKVSVEKLFCVGCTLSIPCRSFMLESGKNLLVAKVFALWTAEFGPEKMISCVPFALFDNELGVS